MKYDIEWLRQIKFVGAKYSKDNINCNLQIVYKDGSCTTARCTIPAYLKLKNKLEEIKCLNTRMSQNTND